jgi:diketogulonate reductase-like aldo/keto reductase
MAYSPVEQDRLVRHLRLCEIATRIGATPTQVALAWTLRSGDVISIPKAASVAHVRENFKAASLQLATEDLEALDVAFPPPTSRVPLEML